MEITLDGLIREVRASSPSPLERLEIASQRAADLVELGDALLNHFVDSCRKEGKTWAEIGEHLGVTRQAAQKRFVEGSQIFERFTDRARLAVARSNDEALAMRHNYIGTEHLLLALFDTNGGVSDVVLQELGLSHDAATREIETIIGRGPGEVTGQQPFTPRAKKVLEEAVNVSSEIGHRYIGTEHLLLALFRGQQGVAKVVLEKHGATEDRVRESILRHLAGYTARAATKDPKTRKAVKPAQKKTASKKAARRAKPSS
jgi:hypothetical protein